MTVNYKELLEKVKKETIEFKHKNKDYKMQFIQADEDVYLSVTSGKEEVIITSVSDYNKKQNIYKILVLLSQAKDVSNELNLELEILDFTLRKKGGVIFELKEGDRLHKSNQMVSSYSELRDRTKLKIDSLKPKLRYDETAHLKLEFIKNGLFIDLYLTEYLYYESSETRRDEHRIVCITQGDFETHKEKLREMGIRLAKELDLEFVTFSYNNL